MAYHDLELKGLKVISVTENFWNLDGLKNTVYITYCEV